VSVTSGVGVGSGVGVTVGSGVGVAIGSGANVDAGIGVGSQVGAGVGGGGDRRPGSEADTGAASANIETGEADPFRPVLNLAGSLPSDPEDDV